MLLPGFIVGGIGIGLVNPALATTAISTVRREQAGVASGINSTFRQVGIATGIAGLGAIFQHQIAAYAAAHATGIGFGATAQTARRSCARSTTSSGSAARSRRSARC